MCRSSTRILALRQRRIARLSARPTAEKNGLTALERFSGFDCSRRCWRADATQTTSTLAAIACRRTTTRKAMFSRALASHASDILPSLRLRLVCHSLGPKAVRMLPASGRTRTCSLRRSRRSVFVAARRGSSTHLASAAAFSAGPPGRRVTARREALPSPSSTGLLHSCLCLRGGGLASAAR